MDWSFTQRHILLSKILPKTYGHCQPLSFCLLDKKRDGKTVYRRTSSKIGNSQSLVFSQMIQTGKRNAPFCVFSNSFLGKKGRQKVQTKFSLFPRFLKLHYFRRAKPAHSSLKMSASTTLKYLSKKNYC